MGLGVLRSCFRYSVNQNPAECRCVQAIRGAASIRASHHLSPNGFNRCSVVVCLNVSHPDRCTGTLSRLMILCTIGIGLPLRAGSPPAVGIGLLGLHPGTADQENGNQHTHSRSIYNLHFSSPFRALHPSPASSSRRAHPDSEHQAGSEKSTQSLNASMRILLI